MNSLLFFAFIRTLVLFSVSLFKRQRLVITFSPEMSSLKYKNIIFDLDGTLLDTLFDINASINEALRICGYSHSFSLVETKYLVGDGADMCVKRALKEKGEDLQAFLQLKATYMPLYREHQNDHARPFPAMKETLEKLAKEGAKLFVCTNKPDALAKAVVESHFGKGLFTQIRGHKEGEPVKPNPFILNLFEKEFGIKKEESLFVGDSHVDMDTAKNGGLDVALCLYGYGVYSEENKSRATYLLDKCDDLLGVVFAS